jgi:hypothetical protein
MYAVKLVWCVVKIYSTESATYGELDFSGDKEIAILGMVAICDFYAIMWTLTKSAHCKKSLKIRIW